MMILTIKSTLIPEDLHAFFTNKAINSDRYPSPLDFSFFNTQDKEATRSNRQLAAESLNFNEKKVCYLKQIHSSRVLFVKSASSQIMKPADGMVTNIKNVGLAILTADCAPLLFFDPITSASVLLTLSILTVVYYFSIKDILLKWGKKGLYNRQKRLQFVSEGFAAIKYIKILAKEKFFFDKFNILVSRP